MPAYYNENDPKAAAWLRELIKQNMIAPGEVDTRSIVEVQPDDVRGFTQCHFFAGIGGWSYAARLAGWDDDRPLWTGSCPCQPFSAAGKQKGTADERHLWPEFRRLIAKCRPATVFGEQVASALGREWLAGVRSDLEALGYGVGAADLCAASVGAPHIRQRLYWLADASMSRQERAGKGVQRPGWTPKQFSRGCEPRRLADAQHDAGRKYEPRRGSQGGDADFGACVGLADSQSGGLGIDRGASGSAGHAHECGAVSWLVNSVEQGLERHAGDGNHGGQHGRIGAYQDRPASPAGGAGYWGRFDIVQCRGGKARRIEPGLIPLAHGIPARVVRLRGYGNAIVPKLAAQFIMAFMEMKKGTQS